jgi:hypothetical protein
MKPIAAAQIERKILFALRKRLDHSGVSLSEIERRFGKKKNWTWNRISGQVRMGVEDLLAILIEIGEDPHAFFTEVIPKPEQNAGTDLGIVELARNVGSRPKEDGTS